MCMERRGEKYMCNIKQGREGTRRKIGENIPYRAHPTKPHQPTNHPHPEPWMATVFALICVRKLSKLPKSRLMASIREPAIILIEIKVAN